MSATIHQISGFEHGNRVRENELTAMRALSAALGELGDDQARERVIRWAIETFRLTIGGAAQPAPSYRTSALPTATIDPTLTVDGIDELFDLVAGHKTHGDRESRPDMSLEITEADLRDEFEYDDESPVAAPVSPDQGVASMLHGFVADFQRLARDWSDGTESDTQRIE